ncbi:Predicted protein tyrosine phosphatase [Pseudoxanthomonas sp. CF125]|nr:Predicted protein tyrosine phosphatase [Pseudoxanthomonas sp. CF125]
MRPRPEPTTIRNVLFVCSRNRLRSPTAEQVFASWPGIETASAGINRDADNPVTPELLQWADLILVMERAHRSKLSAKFSAQLASKRMVCLEIPDDFDYMEPALVELLKARVPRYLPAS